MSEPDYPEYEQLVQVVHAQSPFIGPHEIPQHQELVRRRGLDWCTAVLGHSTTGSIRSLSTFECRLLKAADEADIHPAIPAHVLAERARAEQSRRALQEQYQRLHERDLSTWQQAQAQCQIPIEVRPNAQGRRYGTGLNVGPVHHVVALVQAASGNRLHQVDRPLCETVTRHKTRQLSAPTDQPATCVQCLKYTTTARRI